MAQRDVIIRELRRMIEELKDQLLQQARRIEQQDQHIEQQNQRIEQLELELAKARKNSSTSSKPPSSDITRPKPKPTKTGRPRKRRQGGQPGHTQHLRQPLAPERVHERYDHEIEDAEVLRLGLKPTGDYDVIQYLELPECPVHVTEHRLMVYEDASGNLFVRDLPELQGPIFGPRLLATIGWLKSVGHCSYTTLEMWMEDVLQVPVSRGYLAKLCTGTISQSLADGYQEVVAAVPHQDQLGE